MSKHSTRRLPSKRQLVGALAVCAAIGSGAYMVSVSGQNALPAVSPAALDEFTAKVLPILSANCMTCHNNQEYAGDLSMEMFKDPKQVLQSAALFEKMHDKLASGKMPPASEAPLSAADRSTLMGWIERASGVAAAPRDAASADPGRVTARRLNRTEYNSTIRELLGVTLKPADEFPVDDSGYGFDNIGDVLTLSPMLMEKYIRAARTVSKAAVFGEAYPDKPTLIVKLQPKKDQDDMPAVGAVLPFSIRGALYTTYHFPVDADYEFHWRYGNTRGVENLTTTDGPPGAPGAPGGGGGRGGGGFGGGRGRGAGAGAPAGPVDPNAPPAPATAPMQPGTMQGGTAAPAPAGPAGPGAGGGAGPGAAGAAAGAARGRVGRGAVSAEDQKARDDRERLGAPAQMMVFTIDGKKMYEYLAQGTQNYDYARGESVVKTHLTAGDHVLRISFPGFADMPDPTKQYGRDGRRGLFIDYLDIHGPFSPSKEPPAGFKKIFICGTPGKYTAQCTKQIVENMATRAYRRPATAQEVQRLVTLVNQVQKQDSYEEGVRVAIEAILMSPNFLFRIERDQPSVAAAMKPGAPALALAPERTGAAAPPSDASYRISDYELASRLSYFIWSTMPDDVLFDLAKQNKLHDKTVLDAQVKRMLVDPKANSLVDNFGEQWLNLRLMDRKKPDAAKFRAVDDELLDAMRKETQLFLGSIIKEDRSVLDLIDGKFTFVNGPLARYYGISGVDGEDFKRVELDGEQRSGLLTQASILSISSYATRTSPVIRGKWVLDNLLGAPPPPPPDGVPALIEKDLGTTVSMRERLAQHRANPSCAACHNSMDPIGLSLENYDAAGGYRTKDGNFDVDSSGTLPDGRKIVGAKGLKQSLRDRSDAFTEHFSDRLMTYALGRGLEKNDRPALLDIVSDLTKNNYKFSVLVTSIVDSRPFQMRSRATQ
jgi:Protein of unknown function (DUF1592)/Protein of unknown function (DUF1588)/Protein of unknown function (DUF1587)/Protein of unknown function (DUF1595)/Protein of unknown function (DUF1585)